MDTIVLRSVKSAGRALALRSTTRRQEVGDVVKATLALVPVDVGALEMEVDAQWRLVLSR